VIHYSLVFVCFSTWPRDQCQLIFFFFFNFSSFAGNKKSAGKYKLQSPFFLNWLEARAGKEIELIFLQAARNSFRIKRATLSSRTSSGIIQILFFVYLVQTKVKKKKTNDFLLVLLFLFCQGVYCFMKLPGR
jgi:hypothetical protein